MAKVWGEKFNRIQFLMMNDLNTPICFLVKNEKDVTDALAKLPGDRASVRTYRVGRETHSKTPFHPNVLKREAEAYALNCLDMDYLSVMVTEGVPIDDNAISAISIVRALEIYTEYAEGPGTVRRLSMGEVTPKSFTWNLGKASAPDERFQKAMVILNKLDCQDIIFEWSWSTKLIGWKKQYLIFWEFMNDGPNAYFDKWIPR